MPQTDAILILGHRLEPDDAPSADLIRRIDCAAALWQETHASIIMPCGGITPGHRRTEAEVMREMLLQRGIPEEIVHPEDRSRITIENISNALRLLGPGKTVALVTSDYHMERALGDCRRAGLDAYGVGAVTPPGDYREAMYAAEARISAEMDARRERGMTDQDIAASLVEHMRRRGATSIEEIQESSSS